MYGTRMSAEVPVELEDLDDALVRLRRLWSASRTHVIDELGRRVEMSSVLVVEGSARAAAAGREATVGDVAGFLDVEHSTASRLVDRAATAGLVQRVPSAHDRRRASVVLTPAGHALRDRASAARLGWLGGVVTSWPERDVRELARLLDRFADAVAAVPVAK